MNILVATMARYGNESSVLQFYTDQAAAGGRREYGGELPLEKFVQEIVALAPRVDFVCVEESGLGAAVVDMLETRGVKVLRSHRLRALT